MTIHLTFYQKMVERPKEEALRQHIIFSLSTISIPFVLLKVLFHLFGNEDIVTSTRTKKADENFVIRASQLYNILSRHMKQLNEPMDKEHLLEAYWKFFLDQYNEKVSCTWRILCLCGYCNPQGKLKLP